MRWLFGLFLLSAGLLPFRASAEAGHPVSRELCASLVNAVAETAPDGSPGFLASYRAGPEEAEVPIAIRNAAFSYDNALTIIALLSCGETGPARQIADAFVLALGADRSFHDGRFRNAYRAGLVKEKPVLLPGWWDASANHWAEDRYQVGSATGNVAWVALALLASYDQTRNEDYLESARRASDWIRSTVSEPGVVGFTGGREGFDAEQVSLPWASTEHNTDVMALANALALHRDDDGIYAAMAQSARAFLDKAFDKQEGCFRMGTTPQGTMRGLDAVALDTQLWPLIALAEPPQEWTRAIVCAESRLKVRNGFDFNNDRDGLWVEGTAQAALIYRVLGRSATANRLLDVISAQISPSGWLFATREHQLSTGLRIGPWSTADDFFYFRRPHLGATAWAVLAANGRNPFLSALGVR